MGLSSIGAPVGGAKFSSNNANPLQGLSQTAQLALQSIGIQSNAVGRVSIQKGQGTEVMQNGMLSVAKLPITPMLTQYLTTLGLVSTHVELALSIQGAETVANLKKKLKTLEEHATISDRLSELSQMIGLKEAQDGFIFVEENGGVVLVESAIEEIGEKE